MRRFGLFCTAVLAFTICASLANASESSYLKTIKLSWIEGGALKSTAADTMFMSTKADTARSTLIDLSDLDWEATMAGAQGGSTPIPIASIDFVVTKANNGAADTISYNIERFSPAAGIKSLACPTCVVDTLFAYNPLSGVAVNSALGNTAVSLGGASPLANVFHGVIVEDPDLNTSILQGGHLRRFRLVTCGDSAGPKLSGVMGFITYIAKR